MTGPRGRRVLLGVMRRHRRVQGRLPRPELRGRGRRRHRGPHGVRDTVRRRRHVRRAHRQPGATPRCGSAAATSSTSTSRTTPTCSVIAPATANVIAKLAHGLADDLLTATLLEFRRPDRGRAGDARRHVDEPGDPGQRRRRSPRAASGSSVPSRARSPHGDEGIGRLAEPEDIVETVRAAARGAPRASTGPLAGRRVLVTAGPTHEPIDPVRFVGNRSSGKMGVAIAGEALARGATVTLVLGPGTVAPPAGVDVDPRRDRRGDARGRARARRRRRRDRDGRRRRRLPSEGRRRPQAQEGRTASPSSSSSRRPTSSRELGRAPASGQVLVGFAAETDDVEAAGRDKLARKGLDLLVANAVGRAGTGFGADTNDAAILAADGRGRAAAHLDQARARRRPLGPDRRPLCGDAPSGRWRVSPGAGRLGRS